MSDFGQKPDSKNDCCGLDKEKHHSQSLQATTTDSGESFKFSIDQYPNHFYYFFMKNQFLFYWVFLLNLACLFYSWWAFKGFSKEVIERRIVFHHYTLVANFIFSFWLTARMEWKIEDYKRMVNPFAPADAPAFQVVFKFIQVLFFSSWSLLFLLPLFSWFESSPVEGLQFWPWFISKAALWFALVVIAGSTMAMAMAYKESVDKEKEVRHALWFFRSFVDIYFYYLVVGSLGILLTLQFFDDLRFEVGGLRLLEVVICFLGAVLFYAKAVYELKNRSTFLWSSEMYWAQDLPIGLIKIITVSVLVVFIPIHKLDPEGQGQQSVVTSKEGQFVLPKRGLASEIEQEKQEESIEKLLNDEMMKKNKNND